MKKSELIKHLAGEHGSVDKAAKRLGYAHRNSVQRFDNELTDRQTKDIIMRMRAKRIKYPAWWNIKKS